MIAAPLWMLTHLEAEGEGMGNKSAHGYIFLLNLLFRPALMVIGLVVGWMIMQTFGFMLKSMLSILYGSGGFAFSGISSIFMFIATIVIFASLALYTVNKAFSLIHTVPDQVFAWVGGHMRGVGGDEGKETQGSFVGAGAYIQRARGGDASDAKRIARRKAGGDTGGPSNPE